MRLCKTYKKLIIFKFLRVSLLFSFYIYIEVRCLNYKELFEFFVNINYFFVINFVALESH